jgi:hypothetical protein
LLGSWSFRLLIFSSFEDEMNRQDNHLFSLLASGPNSQEMSHAFETQRRMCNGGQVFLSNSSLSLSYFCICISVWGLGGRKMPLIVLKETTEWWLGETNACNFSLRKVNKRSKDNSHLRNTSLPPTPAPAHLPRPADTDFRNTRSPCLLPNHGEVFPCAAWGSAPIDTLHLGRGWK